MKWEGNGKQLPVSEISSKWVEEMLPPPCREIWPLPSHFLPIWRLKESTSSFPPAKSNALQHGLPTVGTPVIEQGSSQFTNMNDQNFFYNCDPRTEAGYGTPT